MLIKNYLLKSPIRLLMVVIIIILLIGVFGFLLSWKQKHSKKPFLEMPEEKTETKQEAQEVKEVFSFIGEIKTVQEGKIIILAKPEKNLALKKETLITILVNEKTKYSQVRLPKVLPSDIKPGEGKSILTRQEVGFSDLQVGQEIMALSNQNIKGLTEFTAIRIEILSVK